MQYARFLSGILGYEFALLVVVCTFPPSAHAQPSLDFETERLIQSHHWPPRPLYGVVFLDRGSTLGFGVEATKDISSKVDVRMSFDQFRYFDRSREADVDYRLTEKLQSASMTLDWHPFGGSFRTSIGVLINKHSLRLDAVPTQSFDLSNEDMATLSILSQSDITDAALDSIDLSIIKLSENILGILGPDDASVEASDLLRAKGQVEFDNFATYVGIGWGNATRSNGRLHYSFDIGMIFLGSSKVDLSVHGMIPDAIRPYAGAELQAILAAEKKELEEDLKDLEIFPMVSFGLSYRF
jgi:hypothetical protein